MASNQNSAPLFADKVYFGSSTNMLEIPNESVHLIITSPPYFNIKDYSKDGYQNEQHSLSMSEDIGSLDSFNDYIQSLLLVWKECERVLKPNGKLCVNVPLMPMLKKDMNTHYQSDNTKEAVGQNLSDSLLTYKTLTL